MQQVICFSFPFSFKVFSMVSYFVIGGLGPPSSSSVVEFVDNCPNLSSLTLFQFGVNDAMTRTIIMVLLL